MIQFDYEKITLEALKKLLAYDPESGLLTWLFREGSAHGDKVFNAKFAGTIAGCFTDGEVVVNIRIDGKQRGFRAHRIAWALYYREWPKEDIDHKDCNPHNNKIKNLRLANSNNNNANRSVVRGRSIFKGVSPCKKGKFSSSIGYEGKQIWLGTYRTEIEAAESYDRAAIKLYGEFAKTNLQLGLFNVAL